MVQSVLEQQEMEARSQNLSGILFYIIIDDEGRHFFLSPFIVFICQSMMRRLVDPRTWSIRFIVQNHFKWPLGSQTDRERTREKERERERENQNQWLTFGSRIRNDLNGLPTFHPQF